MAHGTLARMTANRVASVAGVLGGVSWLAKVGLIWANGGTNTDEGIVAVLYLAGLLVLAIAALAAGYAVVTTAPIWLRVVVSVATLALFWILYSVIDSAAQAMYSGGGWLDDELGIVVTAVLALLVGLVALARRDRTTSRPQHAHVA